MINFLHALMEFLVNIFFDLLIFAVMFYFLLELVGTHAHHPIKQAILRYTQPLIDPLHKIFPFYRNLDLSLLFLMIFLEIIKLLLLFLLAWQFPNLALLFVWSIFLIINTFFNFYFFLMLFRLFISWVIPIYSNHPATQLLFILTEPMLRPIRTRFAPITGFDWTPIAAIILLKIMSILIGYALRLLGAPALLI